MRTCDLGFEHEEPEPEPVVLEEPSAEAIAEEESGAVVKVAEIEAARDVEVAKIANKAIDAEAAAEMAALRARVEILEAAAVPPEPEPVIMPVAEPAPEPDPEPTPPPPETEPKAEAGKESSGWWGSYR